MITPHPDAACPPFSVIIVAGGSGTRLGSDMPKQYQKIGHFSILEQCIKQFLSCVTLSQIRLVCDPAHANLYHDTLTAYHLPQPAPSGKDRKQSVFNGLMTLDHLGPQEIILIHDAARPMVSRAEIEAVARAAARDGAATLAVPVADTLRREGGGTIDRAGLWAVQTPQAFRFGLLRAAHEQFRNDDRFTDDASLVEAAGHSVTIVPGNRRNFKITTQDDLDLARTIMSDQMETRTGFGFDVHAFDPAKPGPVMLGGVAIPHPRGLAGHSDADVGLHALTDALLSTIAAGDIGTHFPPSDPQWKGADSTVFLAHAIKLLHEKKAAITLLDLTFLCEEPRIGPHREAMQRVISRVSGVSEDRISIKATTTEKLGFTGRGEGIAAQALATVQFPK
ncbi:MAG: bifunctional 2-C-methyl-D-erythritol 4-phosphate cytidylyltransferase/2-C-methyl-D-erythritol 2,4-cyclodiphosphate synthase [Micavibrio aeruginosavorus]|nr:bifunctional 2-C-methyl-D-erythritol 4-phosphate cytidylyltransferase/2-C-methyl-D-erythritol 2,4-cyclodiphosphate synthase [Micavibrio aeruginosavorus]